MDDHHRGHWDGTHFGTGGRHYLADYNCDGSLINMSVFKEGLFKGKVALITGGSRGGMLYETAKQILLHGADGVAIVGRNEVTVKEAAEKLKGETRGRVLGVKGDVRKATGCDGIVDAVLAEFGRIDFLINGAAGNFLA